MREKLITTVLSLAIWHAVGASNVEGIFLDASEYTVYIETRIEVPFVDDDPGVFEGAGFVVDADRRWVMTNAHVVGRSPAEITLQFKGGEPIVAWPVYIDPYLDLAILEFTAPTASKIQAAELTCDSIPAVGHPVGAFGHPEGLKFTGTRGIVSGITPRYGAEWIQTDAPINYGNSGGPLVSLETGNVVGISSATLHGQDVQNANFAVIGQQACRVLRLLADGRDPRPADLGVLYYEIEGEPSLRVAHINSHAMRIGLSVGDLLIGVKGKRLGRGSEGELVHELRESLDGATLMIERPGRGRLEIVLPDHRMASVTGRRGILVGGALFAETNHQDSDRLVDEPRLMVHYIVPGSAAEAAELAIFDHVVEINGALVGSLAGLQRAVDTSSAGSLSVTALRFVTDSNRFIRHVLAELPIDDTQEVGFANGSSRLASK